MAFTFDNTWIGVCLLTICLTVSFRFNDWQIVRDLWMVGRSQGGIAAMRCCGPRLKKLLLWAAGSLVFAAVFHLSVNRTFDKVLLGDELVLDYPWPRRDIRIPWKDLREVTGEHKRAWKQGLVQRLWIVTGDNAYHSLWTDSKWSSERVVTPAREAIEARWALARQTNSLPSGMNQ